MARSWYLLDLGASATDHSPHLLISTAFEANSYTIHLTDLTNIWVESLGRADILRRAEEENTSIDPTDSSQLRILLKKLGSALSSDPRSTLNLHVHHNSGRVRPAVTLNLTIELPGGLAPLRWPVNLAVAPQTLLTNELTIPLVQAQHARIREIESLKEIVKEKDHVIQKLMDKMEAQGIDVGQVFPQATTKGGRKVDRARADEKVRGLRQFDLEVWNKELSCDPPTNKTQLLQSVFTGDAKTDQEIERTTRGEDSWWEKIENAVSTTRSKVPSKSMPTRKESTQDNDAFQVQSSPAHRAAINSRAPQSVALDESTDDEDLDHPSHSTVPDSFPSQSLALNSHPKSSKASKLGRQRDTSKIAPSPLAADDTTDDEEPPVSKSNRQFDSIDGGKSPPLPTDNDSTNDSEEPPAKPTKNPSVGKVVRKKVVEVPKAVSPPPPDYDETTEDEDEPIPPPAVTVLRSKNGGLGRIGGKKEPLRSTSSSASPSPPAVEAPKPKKGKLGQIGGKKKNTPPASQASLQVDVAALQNPAKKKLGAIGGRSKTPDKNSAREEVRARSAKPEKVKTPPNDTPEERAEKKRRELKRDLEEKANVPVKKKRKF